MGGECNWFLEIPPQLIGGVYRANDSKFIFYQ